MARFPAILSAKEWAAVLVARLSKSPPLHDGALLLYPRPPPALRGAEAIAA